MTEYVYSKVNGKRFELLARYGDDWLWLLPDDAGEPFTAAGRNYSSGPKPAEGQMWRHRGAEGASAARVIQLVASGWVIIQGAFELHKAYRIDEFMDRYEYAGN